MRNANRLLDLYLCACRGFIAGVLVACAIGLAAHAQTGTINSQTSRPPGTGSKSINAQTLLNLELPDTGYDTLAHADLKAASLGRTLVLYQHWPTLATYTFLSTVRYTASAQLQAAAPPASLMVTGGSWINNVATYTVASAATVIVGMNAFVAGVSPVEWNTAGTVLSKTSTTLSISMQTPPGAYSSGGTAALQHVITAPCPGGPSQWPQTQFFDWSLGGSFAFTDSSCMPNAAWFGAPGNNTGTDELDALVATEKALANNPLGRHTRAGQPVKQGAFYANATTHPISAFLPLLSGVRGYCLGGYGAFNGTGAPSALHNCVLALALGVAPQGSPEYPMVRTDPDYGGGNTTYGTGIYNWTLDCQAGFYSQSYSLLGNNASCSAWEFYGAQGSGWDDITLRNIGERGIVAPLPTAEVTTALGWTADTLYPLNATILDSNFPFHIQKVTTSGTTGHTDPGAGWNKVGSTTTSGTAVFTDQNAELFLTNSGLFHAGFLETLAIQQGPALELDTTIHVDLAKNFLESVNPLNGYWPGIQPPTTAVPANTIIVDPAGFAQMTTAGGTPGGTIPSFNDTAFGSTTTDGTVTWVRKYKAVDFDGDLWTSILIKQSDNVLVPSQECEANLGSCIKIAASTNVTVEHSVMHPVLPAFTAVPSLTSNPIAMGALTFTLSGPVASGQYFQPGMLVSIVADKDDWMVATVTSYSGTSLVVNVPYAGWMSGGGTYSSWSIAGGAPNAVIIGAGSANVTLHDWFSFSVSPNLYVTSVNDRAKGIARPGNVSAFPSLDYRQNDSQFAPQYETLAINPSGNTLLLAAGLNILGGQYSCGVKGAVQFGGFISNCPAFIPSTAVVIVKGYDATGFSVWESGLYSPGLGFTRIRTAVDNLIVQGGLDDSNPRDAIVSVGDFTTTMYPKIHLTVGGLGIFSWLGAGVAHSSAGGVITSSKVLSGELDSTAGFSGTKTRTACATISGGVPTGCSNVTETYVNGLLQ